MIFDFESDKFMPIHDRVFVKRLENEDKTPAGLIIPDAAKEKAQLGKVIAVGAGRITIEGRVLPMTVKAGDIVFFGKYSGTEAGKEYIVIKEDEILGIVEKVN